MLNIKNLTVYSEANKIKNYLLNDICFKLDKGDCLGIYGRSGSGKSTLAKALLEIYDNNVYRENGEILLDNQPFNLNFRGKKISIIFQNPNTYLNPLMKVGKQIEEMLTYHFKMEKKLAKEKVLSLMNKVGISNPDKIYTYYPNEISGGTQQKICLCISLICEPQILILDESTSYLDKDSKKEILDLIKRLQKENNFTLIMISHDLKEIYEACNKIAILRNGVMIEFGKKDEIVLNPSHPFTIELLIDYLSFYINTEKFTCPLMEIENIKPASFTMISDTHYVRNWYFDKRSLPINLPNNIEKIKEKIYESLNN